MDGHDDGRGAAGRAVPAPPRVPPMPTRVPAPPPPEPPGAALQAWVRASRPDAPPGIWRLGHRPRPETEPALVPPRQLIGGAVLALLMVWLIWSIFYNGYFFGLWIWPLKILLPDDWLHGGAGPVGTAMIYYGYYAVVAVLLLFVGGRKGRWPELWRRYGRPLLVQDAPQPPPVPEADLARWPQLREAGQHSAADRLTADAAAGAMNDVDVARLSAAWAAAVAAHQADAYEHAVLKDGGAAFLHPSGQRDLPGRRFEHDLLARQVRLGRTVDSPKNAYAYRTLPMAVGPEVLGTGMVVVGPAGSGKTDRVLRPVAEALCLQALTGQASVVAVGAGLGPAEQYDVVIRLGDPASDYDLDLYGSTDVDTAAAVLADALAGNAADPVQGRSAAAALAQLLGPWQAAYGRLPLVPELRQLLDGDAVVLRELRERLEAAGHGAMLRELDARDRAAADVGDVTAVLADRISVLDRPAFAGFFDTTGRGRPFSMRVLEHPVRVRIDLPARGHFGAAALLTRLVLAQFVAAVPTRRDTSRYAGLVVDDAGGAVTAETLRGMHRLGASNAGVVLALRGLADVPEALRTQLLGTVGCRVAMPCLSPADGQALSAMWGTEWTQAQDRTIHPAVARGAPSRAAHLVRRAFTGEAPTIESVTVRQVERERWSASELGHAVPLGHAVVSLTGRGGERTPPLLVDLRA